VVFRICRLTPVRMGGECPARPVWAIAAQQRCCAFADGFVDAGREVWPTGLGGQRIGAELTVRNLTARIPGSCG